MSLNQLAELAVILQALILAVGIIFAVVPWLQAQKARHLATIEIVFEGFHNAEAYRERQAILARGPVAVKDISQDEQFKLMGTSDYFQRIGFLVNHRFISGRYVLQMYSGTIVSIWECVRPFVEL